MLPEWKTAMRSNSISLSIAARAGYYQFYIYYMAKKTLKHKHKSIVSKDALDFLREYINTPSPVGFETCGQKVWLNYIKNYVDTTFTDPYGTAVGVINPDAGFKVVIEAHADEISWFVNYINEQGIIYLKRNGGVDHQIAPAMRVLIHGKKGAVKAVFGWPAIHTRHSGTEAKEPQPKPENLFLDCGARNKKEVEALGIHIGAVVTYQDGFDEIAHNYFIGRAFDNRVGGFMIAEVARLINENKNKLPFGLYVVNAVQEEIGLRGAEMIAHHIKPNLAIVTDVTHDTQTPMISKITQGDLACGKGPVVSYAPAVQNNVNKLLIETAEKADIPFQRQASSRSTGTDTDAFAYSNDGVPSALISLPLRYMHTTVEMIHKEDVDNVIRLIYEVLLHVKDGQDFRYIK